MSTTDTDTLQLEPIRDPDLWFEDGNTVVIAQKSAFRVHRSVLSRHSDVFGGLFTLPQPADLESSGSIDGCPVVRVADSAHDFQHLLHALYDGVESVIRFLILPNTTNLQPVRRSYLKHDKRAEFSELAALARLGHKYQLDTIVVGVCGRFTTVFSVDPKNFNLTQWGEGMPPINLDPKDAIEAFNLFRLLGREDLIPVALYACCQLPIAILIPGVNRKDGTCEQLSLDDLQLCLTGREALTTSFTWRANRIFSFKPGDKCSTPENCTRFLSSINPAPPTSKIYFGACLFSRPTFTSPPGQLQENQVFCNECREMLIGRDRSFRKIFWEHLPKMLKLEVKDWPPFDD